MIGIAFDEDLALSDQLEKKTIAKIRKRTTFRRQPLDNTLSDITLLVQSGKWKRIF